MNVNKCPGIGGGKKTVRLCQIVQQILMRWVYILVVDVVGHERSHSGPSERSERLEQLERAQRAERVQQ